MISILIPTLGRADRLVALAENIADTTPTGYELMFVIDADDSASKAAAKRAPAARFTVCDGSYPVKINAGFRATVEPLVLPTADDVIFHDGWLETAAAAFAPGIEVVGTNDTTPATADGTHATMPILTRRYCENPGASHGVLGAVFHEGYRHNYVETEVCQLAQARGVWKFEHRSTIEHLHPDWGTREEDATDQKGNRTGVERDHRMFIARRGQWLRS